MGDPALTRPFQVSTSSFDSTRTGGADEAVLAGDVDAGLVIHEAQITYDKQKFTGILELGQWWDSHTGGLPVPNSIFRNLVGDTRKRKGLNPEPPGPDEFIDKE